MVAVKMGGPMPPMPMGGMQQPLNPLPTPMPVPPMQFGQQPVGALPAQAAGTAPVAPIMRSNAGRRKRFGDSLEGMLAIRRPPMAASDQMAGMNVFTGQMPRGQMMGGTAMQPPVRRMMGGGPVPRRTDIYGQDHMLAYIRPDEADLLMGLGGAGTPGPGGIPQFGLFDFFSDLGSSIKDAFTGGSSSSSSSQSYTSPSNDPYAEDRPSTSQSSADAGKQYAESMIAGGGGTNLSGSGSTAMEKLLAAQKAQTQKDDGPPPDVTGSFSSPPSVVSQQQDAMDFINQQFYKQQEEQRKNDEIRAAREAEAKAVREAEAAAEAAALAAQEASFNQPSDPLDIFGGAGPDIGSDPNYVSDGVGYKFDPIVSSGTGTSGQDAVPNVGDLNFLDPSVLYYDIDGVPHNTEAEQQEANRLINQRIEREREEQRIAQAAADEAARIQAEVAAREQAERERIAQQAAAEAEMGLDPFGGTGGPDDPSYVSDVFETPPFYKQAQAEAEMGLDSFGGIGDPINEGLGKDISLDKKVTDADKDPKTLGEHIKNFTTQLAEMPGNIANDFQMALDAGLLTGLLGGYEAMEEKLLKVKNPDGTLKYTPEQVKDYIQRTKDKQALDKKNAEEASKNKSTTDDGTVGGVGEVVDPCPDGFKLDPTSGICVPVKEDDTEEDEDSGDDKEEDTSDDELSGVVVTPPPPKSYLDNPIRMNRGGSVGLNRAADNFLAAMGA